MPVTRSRSGTLAGTLHTIFLIALLAGYMSLATPRPQPATAVATASNDYCGGRCSGIPPPGRNGKATLAQIILNQAFGAQPEHADDSPAIPASLPAIRA
jgi:hypothetical protein